MSETLIASLQQRLDQLMTENASLKSENKDRRIKGKAATAELEQLREQAKALAAERDSFKLKAESSQPELQATIDDLAGKLRGRDHKDAFAAVKEFEVRGQDGKTAKYKLAEGVSIDDVWQLTGYTPEGATPEGKAVTEQLGKALQARPYLFDEAAAADPRGSQRPLQVQAREGGIGAGKSASQTLAASGSQAGHTGRSIPGRI